MSDSPYRGPRSRPAAPSRHGELPAARVRDDASAADATNAGDARPRRNADEVRLYGFNACMAAFTQRPQDLRKVYLVESRMRELRDVLAWCVKQRLGYRVVEAGDLDKLAQSTHHEGVIFEMRRAPSPSLRPFLAALEAGPQLLLWLDGVGNPHNFGAVLRCAAHFGAAGVLLPQDSTLTRSGAAARVAEGGAEFVPAISLPPVEEALTALNDAGFALAATVPRDAPSLYACALPARLVLVFGAEGEGMSPALLRACTLRFAIPGTGRVESLNIANAAGVMLGEWWRQLRRLP